VSRHAPVGYVISRVFARDADFANNARLSYHVVSGDGGRFFDVDRDLGAVSVAGDLRQADLDRYDLALAVTDGGVPPQSAVVTLTVNLVSTAWTQPYVVSGSAVDNDDRRPRTVADVFFEHRLILVVLAVSTVALTVLLILAIACFNCRQVTLDIGVSHRLISAGQIRFTIRFKLRLSLSLIATFDMRHLGLCGIRSLQIHSTSLLRTFLDYF